MLLAVVLPIEAMPAVSMLTKDWAGDGIEMTAPVLRRIKAHLEKGEDIRIRAAVDGVTRYARVSQGKEDHERTGPEGAILSVVVADSVTEEEKKMNPLIQLVQQHESIFVSRTGSVHSSLPTVTAVLLIDPDGGKNDLMLPQPEDISSLSTPADIAVPQSVVAINSSTVDNKPLEVDSSLSSRWILVWKDWAAWLYSWVEDARHAPVLVVLGKGLIATASNPLLHIPMVLISGIWLIQALNLTFSSIVTVTMDSAVVVGKWLVLAIDDFFEGHPIARFIMVVVGLYLGMVLTSAVCYFIGGLIVSTVCRSGRRITTVLLWCCRRKTHVAPVINLSMPTAPEETMPPYKVVQTPTVVLPPPAIARVEAISLSSIDPHLSQEPSRAPIITEDGMVKSCETQEEVLPNLIDSIEDYTQVCKVPSPSLDSLPDGELGSRTSMFSTPDTTRACQAHKITLHNSGNRLTDVVCAGKRVKEIRLLSSDRFLGQTASNDAPEKFAFMCGKHRELYIAHRDASKCQKDDCWETGIVLQIDSKKVLECPVHLQLRLNEAQSVSHVELRRAAKADRRGSIQSRTSTESDQPSFGSGNKSDTQQRERRRFGQLVFLRIRDATAEKCFHRHH